MDGGHGIQTTGLRKSKTYQSQSLMKTNFLTSLHIQLAISYHIYSIDLDGLRRMLSVQMLPKPNRRTSHRVRRTAKCTSQI